eukprot:501201-Prymnesium_polylepis.2
MGCAEVEMEEVGSSILPWADGVAAAFEDLLAAKIAALAEQPPTEQQVHPSTPNEVGAGCPEQAEHTSKAPSARALALRGPSWASVLAFAVIVGAGVFIRLRVEQAGRSKR